jgi:CBS domain-containing protein
MWLKIVPDVIGENTVCTLPEEAPVAEAARLMADCNVDGVAILDPQGHLAGVVTERDIARRVVAEELDPRATPIREIMTRHPDALAPDDLVLDAVELMAVRKASHFPVIGDDGGIIGLVSVSDLLNALRRQLEEETRDTEAKVFGAGLGG